MIVDMTAMTSLNAEPILKNTNVGIFAAEFSVYCHQSCCGLMPYRTFRALAPSRKQGSIP
jgi:hypothetical protein